MKHIICALSLAATLAWPCVATEPADSIDIVERINNSGNITVEIPAALMQRLQPAETQTVEESTHNASVAPATRVGYRVQVFDDNNVSTAKHQAQARRQQMQSRFPEFRTYIQFNSPYWRVKVGDFKTRSEAEAAMGTIRAAFPALGPQLRVVRDRINP